MLMEDPGFGDGHFGDIAKWDHGIIVAGNGALDR